MSRSPCPLPILYLANFVFPSDVVNESARLQPITRYNGLTGKPAPPKPTARFPSECFRRFDYSVFRPQEISLMLSQQT